MTNLPDNLLNRASRLYIDNREFTDESGKVVSYNRGVLEIMVKDEPVNIEFKLDKKDMLLLSLADNRQNDNLNQ